MTAAPQWSQAESTSKETGDDRVSQHMPAFASKSMEEQVNRHGPAQPPEEML